MSLTTQYLVTGGLFHLVPPKAGSVAYVKYFADINSTELSYWFRIDKNVFILPGDVFETGRYIRIGIGAEKNYLINGLERIGSGFAEIIP